VPYAIGIEKWSGAAVKKNIENYLIMMPFDLKNEHLL
jgi:hypothetical protein